jgi:hypothetical protein
MMANESQVMSGQNTGPAHLPAHSLRVNGEQEQASTLPGPVPQPAQKKEGIVKRVINKVR